MSATIIDGRAISRQIKNELVVRVERLKQYQQNPVTIVIVKVGHNPASEVYVRNKMKACKEIGVECVLREFDKNVRTSELILEILRLNADNDVDGILIQLPLPKHLDGTQIISAISRRKDIDGFHPYNVGKLVIGDESFVPATAAGVIELLTRSGVEIDGKECVVVGRSSIVGKPVAQLLLAKNGTVTIAHSHTKNLAEVTRRADILVVAAGKRHLITAEHVKPGAVVIDVGIHRDENNKLSGDVDFESVKDVASAITPVPGGVGPMTIAMLLDGCVKHIEQKCGLR